MIRKLLLLAGTWLALSGDVSPWGVAFALALAVGALTVAWPLGPFPAWPVVKPHRLVGLFIYLAVQIVIANLQVAAAVLWPRRFLQPAIVAVPLDARSDDQITVLANFVTLTPGTLSLDVSPDRKTLYVHAMFASSPEDVRRSIKDGFERRIVETFP